MPNSKFFPERKNFSKIIYAYSKPGKNFENLLNIGETTQTFDQRMKQQFPKKGPNDVAQYYKQLEESAIRSDGTTFSDHQVHKILKQNGFENVGGEWFKCEVNDVKAAIVALRNNENLEISRTRDFKLRPEQELAIKMTSEYFKSYSSIEKKSPHFLWNCKMRFGKTFSTYKLAEKMKWKKVLILTFKPAVQNAWEEDLLTHIDFKKWQFISKDGNTYDDIDKEKPFVCFASFQDFLGKNPSGGIKVKNKWAHKVKWDCIVLDEYHFGAWRDAAKELYRNEDNKELKESGLKDIESWDEEISPLKTKSYLYLSGTPFRALAEGEFVEDQIFNWTYLDEQESKNSWKGKDNPYISLPRIVMLTYKLPESITEITNKGEFDQFDLTTFFSAEGNGDSAKFKYEDDVQKWLNLITNTEFNNIYTNLRLGSNKPILPYNDSRLLNILTHTLWFLPSVASCYAMRNLLNNRVNSFFHDYKIIVAAGAKAGIGVKALEPLKKEMSNPIKTKTITLSCGKLTTGVTVRPWSGLFMLSNCSTPETYFQTAFRVQSPWTVESESEIEILKDECYIFDFAPNRALRLVSDYSCRLNSDDKITPEEKVNEFTKFLPILHFDGSSMERITSEEVLDIGLAGTSGSQLAKKFESARLVNVDNATLLRLLDNKTLLNSLMEIEGYSNLKEDAEKIINRSEKIKSLKNESVEDELSPKNKRELSIAEKERKDLRKKMQENIQRIAIRIPVFMYLTDYREQRLKDVITQLEPGLFKKVTGLTIKDFEQVLSLGLLNNSLMDEAVFHFRRYEDSSLNYAGGFTKYEPEQIGLWDTTTTYEEFKNI